MFKRLVMITATAALVAALFQYRYGQFLIGPDGHMAADYELFLPNLLAGDYWQLGAGPFQVPWWSPARCGGFPFFPDPNVAYYSVPQWLTFVVSPVTAVLVIMWVFLTLGFVGALGALRQRVGIEAALLGAAMWALQGFYGTRMDAGHLTYHAFMLLPWLIWSCGQNRDKTDMSVLCPGVRLTIGAAAVAYTIYAGASQLLPPMLLGVAMVLVLDAMRQGWSTRPWAALGVAVAAGLLLAGPQLVATHDLLAQFPRDQYPLPGFRDIGSELLALAQALFWNPSDGAAADMTNIKWALGPHEWAYGISPVPAYVLALELVGLLVFRDRRPAWRGVTVLTLLAIVPLAVNFYEPTWNAWLKATPALGSSSTLIRWWSAYLLPLTVMTARIVDYVGWRFATACALILAGFTIQNIHDPSQMPDFDPSLIESGWERAQISGPPPITEVGAILDEHNQPRGGFDDTMVLGRSQIACYQPLFGYAWENFPAAPLHLGPALADLGGILNFKNPACYVWPELNHCRSGDHFRTDQSTEEIALLTYVAAPGVVPDSVIWWPWWLAAAWTLAMGSALTAMRSRPR